MKSRVGKLVLYPWMKKDDFGIVTQIDGPLMIWLSFSTGRLKYINEWYIEHENQTEIIYDRRAGASSFHGTTWASYEAQKFVICPRTE